MRVFAIMVFMLAQAGAATAETYSSDVGGREVYMEVPDGQCVLTGADPNEAMVLEFLDTASAGVNFVLMAFADCRQLQDWKQGRRATLDEFGYIATPAAMPEVPGQNDLNAVLDQQFSQMPESEFGRLLGLTDGRAQAKLDELAIGAQLHQTIPLGYFGFDSNGSYMGLIQKLSTDRVAEKTMITMFSSIAVNNRILLLYLVDSYAGNVAQVDEMLKRIKTYSRWQHEVN